MIAAGGTLGILIPPSVVLAIYGFITEQDVGRLFIAGICRACSRSSMYMVDRAPRLSAAASCRPARRSPGPSGLPPCATSGRRCCCSIAMIGGHLRRDVTPTEAAAAGAFGAFLIGIARRLRRDRASWPPGRDAAHHGRRLHHPDRRAAVRLLPRDHADAAEGHRVSGRARSRQLRHARADPALFVVMGCVLDALAMIILTVPIVFPVIQTLGFDPIWFGVIVVMTVELGLITPPVGMNVFVINDRDRGREVSDHLLRRDAVHRDRHRAPDHPHRVPDHRAVSALADVRRRHAPALHIRAYANSSRSRILRGSV